MKNIEYQIKYSKIKNIYIQIKKRTSNNKSTKKSKQKRNRKTNRTKSRMDTKKPRKRKTETIKTGTIYQRRI